MPTYRTWELDVNYKMGDTVLGTTVKEKDLGVTISADMKVSQQCGIVVMRVCNILDCSNFIIGDDLNTSFQCVSSNLTKRLNYICDDESIKPCIGFEGNN